MSLGAGPAQLDVAAPAVRRRRRHLVLLLAFVTTAVEAASIAHLLPPVPVGPLDLPTSLVPAAALAAACGTRLAGRSSRRRLAVGYWAIVAVILVGLAGAYAGLGRFPMWVALIVAALGEELVYRLAVPAAVAALLRRGGVRPGWARTAGLVLASLWFVLLPGHIDQMSSPAMALPFVAFAALSAFVVYRSGSVLPIAASHAIGNLLTVLLWSDTVEADVRSMLLSCVLGLLVLAYGRPRRLTLDQGNHLVDTRTGLDVAVIDLRHDRPHTVQLTDGTTIPLEGGVALPPAVRPRV